MDQHPIVRITKQFRFEAAHVLWNYDGPCKNIHGHSYVLFVTVKGSPLQDPSNPKHGMLIDFSVLKEIVHKIIIDPYDHALMINANTPHREMTENNRLFGKVVGVPYQPTCENMVHDFAVKLKANLPEGIKLHAVRLHETTTAYAEWYAEDNRNS